MSGSGVSSTATASERIPCRRARTRASVSRRRTTIWTSMKIDDDLERKLLTAEIQLHSGVPRKQCFADVFDFLVARELVSVVPPTKDECRRVLDGLSKRLYDLLVFRGLIKEQRLERGRIIIPPARKVMEGTYFRLFTGRYEPSAPVLPAAPRLPTHEEARRWYWEHRIPHWLLSWLEERRRRETEQEGGRSQQGLHHAGVASDPSTGTSADLRPPDAEQVTEVDLEALIRREMTVPEPTACQYLGVGERQVRRLISAGSLTAEGKGKNRRVTTKSLRLYKSAPKLTGSDHRE